MAEGYIHLHRRLLDWEWFTDSAMVHVWVYLLLRVNWTTRRWQGIDIHPGQVVTSRDRIAEACGLTEKQVRRVLDELEKGRMIERKRAGFGQLVTLVNWAEYQDGPIEEGRQRADERAGKGPDEGRQRAGNEEGKKERREEVNPSNMMEGENLNDHDPEPSKLRKKAPRVPRRPPIALTGTLEERREQFRAMCQAVTNEEPDRLAKDQRKAFFEYWTEPDGAGVMRFEAEKYFSTARRMDTWMRRSGSFAGQRPATKDSAERADLDLTFDGVTN